MLLLVELRQETEPSLLRHHSFEDAARVGNEYLPSAELDEQLLDQFERRVSLHRDRCLLEYQIWLPKNQHIRLTRSMYREMS